MLRALLLTFVYLMMAVPSTAAGADASALFADGERAFAAGEYQEALRLFTAAREAGSTGPSSYYNIGVCQYRLGDYAAAEATFATLAGEFPALRELAEYNRGLALRAAGNMAAARVAFERARSSTDDKIVALANAQLGEIGAPRIADEPRWTGYLAGGLGYDDNVALLNELVLASSEASSPLAEVLGVLTRDFGARPLRFDLSGYAVHYPDVGDFDQTAIRVSLGPSNGSVRGRSSSARRSGAARSMVTASRSSSAATYGFAAASASDSFSKARAIFDDASAADPRFAYLEGSRSLVRLSLQHVGAARIRAGYDFERNDRADPGVSPDRERWSVVYQRRLSDTWSADAMFAHRTSRYSAASVPREESLLELSLAARREVGRRWVLGVEYQWFDNDSTADEFAYDGQRVALGLSRSFYGS